MCFPGKRRESQKGHTIKRTQRLQTRGATNGSWHFSPLKKFEELFKHNGMVLATRELWPKFHLLKWTNRNGVAILSLFCHKISLVKRTNAFREGKYGRKTIHF
jgi:hypothetical protein